MLIEPGAGALQVGFVLTTINEPNQAVHAFANGCRENGWRFYVIGDQKGPSTFECDGVFFHSLADQLSSAFDYARSCPTNHYARKNVGYLLAIEEGANIIVESDDDNIPTDAFWSKRVRQVEATFHERVGWTNVYRYFTSSLIWPRGFPLDEVANAAYPFTDTQVVLADCPIQQGLADDNPDVDAVYRLILPLPQRFEQKGPLALGERSWCPFNSQNTSWWSEAFPLLYLPASCSFRMTDIWRSFVAQRIAWQFGWRILFHEATVFQVRNAHNIMNDFRDEVCGYLHNRELCSLLERLELSENLVDIEDNMRTCYRALVKEKFLEEAELDLLETWLADLQKARERQSAKSR